MIGALPDHCPVDAVSTCPSIASPVTFGGTVRDGGLAATTPVTALAASASPPRLEACSTMRIVDPTSAGVSW